MENHTGGLAAGSVELSLLYRNLARKHNPARKAGRGLHHVPTRVLHLDLGLL